MIDIRILRENPENVRDNLLKRNMGDFPFDDLLSLDRKRRELLTGNQKLKAERNKISVEISQQKRQGKDASSLIGQMKEASDTITSNDKETQHVENEFMSSVSQLPN